MNSATITTEIDDDPHKYFWFAVYVLIMAVAALPLFGLRIPRIFPYTPTLVVHEFAAFAFVGHTFFSNIWSLRIRATQPRDTRPRAPRNPLQTQVRRPHTGSCRSRVTKSACR